MSIQRLLQIGFRAMLVAPLLVLGCGFDGPVSISIPEFGTLVVTTETSGSNLDPNGYRLAVTGETLNVNRDLGLNDSVTFSVLRGAECAVELSDIATNCSTETNPQFVSPPVGNVTTVTFTVSCT